MIGLADCLEGNATGQADEDILDKYDEVRRSIYRDYIDPVSTTNYLRISALGTDDAIEKDPFIAMCASAKSDLKVKEQMEKVSPCLCSGFSDHADSP